MEMKLSCSNIKKFLLFSRKKAFLIFREIETPQKFLIFQETSYILETELSGLNITNFKVPSKKKFSFFKSF